MKNGELFLRCALDAIDQPVQRICTENKPQLTDYKDESDILPRTLPPHVGVTSDFEAIDRVTSGWQSSDLILVAAQPSMSKTAFGLSMARNIVVDRGLGGVAFFSLEMSTVRCMMRLITAETGLPNTPSRAV